MTIPHDSQAGRQSGLLSDSVVMTDNLATIVESALDDVIGNIPMVDIDHALRHTLERENNPAAVVILAHRTAQERRRDPVQREASKWALTRQL